MEHHNDQISDYLVTDCVTTGLFTQLEVLREIIVDV